MGKFYNWMLLENLDNNPGEYWYQKFDDFLNGEDYEKESWLKGVVDSAKKLYYYIKPIIDISYRYNKQYYSSMPTTIGNENIYDILENIVYALDVIVREFSKLEIEFWRKDDILYGISKESLKEINNIDKIASCKRYFKPEVFNKIDITINFINRIFEILDNPSFKSNIINHKFRNHTNDKITEYAKSFVKNMEQLEKSFGDIIEISVRARKRTIPAITRIANGEDVIENYSHDNFLQFSHDDTVFNVTSEGMPELRWHRYADLAGEVRKDLQNLIKAIEFSHGMLKTE